MTRFVRARPRLARFSSWLAALALPAIAAAAVVTAAAPATAHAQSAQGQWPVRPVRIIIPYPPGGQTDIVGRWVGEKLSAAFGQPFVIDNRAGAQAIVGISAAKQSAPDGYTFVFTNTSNIVINKFMYTKLPYDGLTDFDAVAQLGIAPLGMVLPPSLNIRNVDEFVAWARKQPGKTSFASFGAGSSSHLYGEMLKDLTKLDMVHVPYKGAGPAVQDIASGNATMGIQDFAATAPFIQSGKLVPIAVTGPRRWPLHPEVKTFTEQGYPMDIAGWVGIHAPIGTPKDIIERVNRELNKVIETKEGTDKMLQLGLLATSITPAEFTEQIRRDYPVWGEVFKRSGITPE
ncbi:MAG: tripartite tricarboxylate transporter substrate binding protein [Burkholderiaceae bacterium]